MSSNYSCDYSKWDNLSCSDEEDTQPVVKLRPKGFAKPPTAGGATVRADGSSKAYTVEMGNDGPCVVEDETAAAPEASPVPATGRPFETRMCWQNTEERTYVQIAVPEVTKKDQCDVKFHASAVEILLAGMQPVRLSHPDVEPEKCRWCLQRKVFYGDAKPSLCLSVELVKDAAALWPQNTFGGGGPEPLSADEEIEAAWAASPAAPPPPPGDAPTEWTGEYTWLQENERVQVWFDVPAETHAKDMAVDCTRSRLTVEVKTGSKVGRYVRDWAAPVRPSELVWQFDDAPGGQRRVRVEVVMVDVASWAEGPFLKEAATPNQTTATVGADAAPPPSPLAGGGGAAVAPPPPPPTSGPGWRRVD